MSEADETYYSIVIVGSMNPAIHHFGWYQLQEILSPQEAEAASKDTSVICSAQISQFSFGSISISCDTSRWQIQTKDERALSRAVAVAEKTFQILYHTPVSLFGFNFNYHRATRLPKVRNALARLVEGLPLALSAGVEEEKAGKLNYQHGGGGRVIRVSIEPSVRGDNLVYVAVNVEHSAPVPKEGEFQQWDLKLEEVFQKDFSDAQGQLAAILQAVDRLEAN